MSRQKSLARARYSVFINILPLPVRSDSSTIFHFAKQFSPESPRRTVDIYRFATRRKCTYLFVDLSQSCPDESRLMSNIFYEDNQDFLTFKNT